MIEDVKDMKLKDDSEGRTDLKFKGKTFLKKPISDTYAELTYKKDNQEYEDKGCFDHDLNLSVYGKRITKTDKGQHISAG